MKTPRLPLFIIWVLMLSASATHANQLLINSNAGGSSFLPLLVGMANQPNLNVQTMYFADQLVELSIGGTIHGMTFYPESAQHCDTLGAIYTIRLFEIDSVLNQAMVDTTGATIVYEGPFPFCEKEMPIEFTTPYIYQGGNLVIDCSLTEPSSKGIKFFTFSAAQRSSAGYVKYWNGASWVLEVQNQQPKVLFNYTPIANFCSAPEDIHISAVTQTDATISWTARNTETGWEVRVDSLIAVVSVPSYTLEQLSSGTTYNKTFAIRSICEAGDTSAIRSSTLRFTTECSDAQLPYVEDFESATLNALLPCWTFSSNTSVTGNASNKYLSLNGTNGTAYAISPKLSRPAKELMISFYEQEHAQYSKWGPYGQCIIGTITDPADISTFTPLDTLPDSHEMYRHVEYFLKDAPVTDYYVMFYFNINNPDKFGSYCYIDNVQIDLIPTCFHVTDLLLDTVFATSAELSWSPGKDEQEWDVLVLNTGGDTLLNNTVTTNHCTITNLTHRTPYSIEVYVRSNCGDGDLSRTTTATFSFETQIACGTPIITLPFFEDFESISTDTRQMPPCWNKIIRPSSWNVYPYVYSNYAYCHSCDNTLYIKGNNYGIYTILPEFSMNVNKLQISLWTHNSMVASDHGSFIIGAMSNPNDSTTFFPIDTLPQNTAFTEHLVYLDRAPAGYKYIAILYDRLSSSSSASTSIMDEGMIDDITVEYAPVCLALEDIQLDSVGSDNVMFSWESTRENPYGYEVTVINEYDSSVILLDTIYTTSVQISDLNFSSEYRLIVSIATICALGHSEPYTKTFIVKTECQPTDSLYREGFEYFVAYPYQAQSISTPNCWNVINANSPYYAQRIYATNTSSLVHSGKQSLLFEYSTYYPSYAIMPETNVNLSTQQISFFYKLTETYRHGELTLGYFPKDNLVDSAFVALTTMTFKSSWDNFKNYRLENVPAGARMAFKYYNPNMPNNEHSYAGVVIDDIIIEDVNNCHPPVSVWVDSITSQSVQIHWQPKDADNTLFNVAILYGKDTLFQVQGYPDTMCVVSGLQYAKYYFLDCYISTICDERTSDELKSYVAFVTECAPFAIPFAENFDEDKFPLMAGDIPFCWQQWGNPRTGMEYWNIGSYNDGTHTHSGSGVLDMFTDSTSWSMVALPELEASVDTLIISFYSKIFGQDVNQAVTLEVGYLPSSADSSSFVSVATIPNYEFYTLSTVTFPDAPEHVHVIAFRFDGGSALSQTYIDDITITSALSNDIATEVIGADEHAKITKFIHNGQLFILRDGLIYTIFGTKINNKEL